MWSETHAAMVSTAQTTFSGITEASYEDKQVDQEGTGKLAR